MHVPHTHNVTEQNLATVFSRCTHDADDEGAGSSLAEVPGPYLQPQPIGRDMHEAAASCNDASDSSAVKSHYGAGWKVNLLSLRRGQVEE